jgi:hypothetical protein
MKMLEKQIASHYHQIEVESDRCYFVDLSDIHVESKGFDERTFKKTIDILSKLPNCYVLLGGDTFDGAVKGSKTSPFETRMSPREAVLYFEKLIEPIKHKIIGKIDGNHDATRSKEFMDFSINEWLCDRNNIPYMREYALLHFSVGKCAFTVHAHHRSGSTGKKVNFGKPQSVGEEWRCDVILGEHTHRKNWAKELYVDIDTRNRKPVIRSQYFVNTNSFVSWHGYAIEQGYRINETGCNVIEFIGGRSENRDIRIHDLKTVAEKEGLL